MQVQSLSWEDSPGGGNGHRLQYPCLEKQRRLVGYSPWDPKELDMTKCPYTHTLGEEEK